MKPHLIDIALEILQSGGLIGFPTETYYGIAALISQPQALERLWVLKDRPKSSPFPLLISRLSDLETLLSDWVEVRELVSTLADRFWPGPLTLVLKARGNLSPRLVGPTGGVAVRISSHPTAKELVERLGSPITATSANFRGDPPAKTAHDIDHSGLAQHLDYVIRGYCTPGGQPSTVLHLERRAAYIVRKGAIHRDELCDVLRDSNVELR